jgi:hypothetical protein
MAPWLLAGIKIPWRCSGDLVYVPGLRLGCGGLHGAAKDLVFGEEPIIEIVAIFSAAKLIQLIRPTEDFFFKAGVRLG